MAVSPVGTVGSAAVATPGVPSRDLDAPEAPGQ
jgi:hypothetical protein